MLDAALYGIITAICIQATICRVHYLNPTYALTKRGLVQGPGLLAQAV